MTWRTHDTSLLQQPAHNHQHTTTSTSLLHLGAIVV